MALPRVWFGAILFCGMVLAAMFAHVVVSLHLVPPTRGRQVAHKLPLGLRLNTEKYMTFI